MMKLKVKNARCHVEFDFQVSGSVLKGTVKGSWQEISTYLTVESDEPEDKLAHLIKNAKAGCFAEGLITQSVPLHSHIEVNGKRFHIEGVTQK